MGRFQSQQHSTPPKPHTPGLLPLKIQKFITISASSPAANQRNHPHRSLINTYMISSFLDEATQSPQPLKRNAGLRDLAQRLHLWPGDVVSELQRDTLVAVELLDGYVREALGAEVRFIVGGMKNRTGVKEIGIEELVGLKEDVVRDLDVLREELIARVRGERGVDWEGDLELNDLAPFIPGFTSTTSTRAQDKVIKQSPKVGGQQEELEARQKLNDFSPARIEALDAIEIYLDKARVAAELYDNIVSDNSLELLRRNMEALEDAQISFENMKSKIASLVDKEGRVEDYDYVSDGEK